MSKGICPDMDGLEWKLLVEETGDFNIAFQVFEQVDPATGKISGTYPAHIMAKAKMAVDSGMPIDMKIDERVIDRKKRMERANDIIRKKVDAIRNRPNQSEIDTKTLIELETLQDELATLDTNYAVSAFIDAVSRISSSADKYLDAVKDGSKEVSLKQLARIQELENMMELMEELLPELKNDPEFTAEAAKGSALLARKSSIKQERLLQQRQLLAKEWGPRVGIIDARYRQDAERKFNKEKRHQYNDKEERKQAMKDYIHEYMIDTAAKRKAETDQYTMEILSSIDDIGSISAMLVNPKDLHSEIVDFATEILDKADFSVKIETIEEAQTIRDLRDKYVEYMGGVVKPTELYDPLLEKDIEGNRTGDYVNVDSEGGQMEEFRRRYNGTPVMDLYIHVTKKQAERDVGLPKYAKLGFQIPRMNKILVERLKEQGVVETLKNSYGDIAKFKDTTELGELGDPTEVKGETKVTTSESGKVMKFVPVHYRSRERVTDSDMSFDIATVAIMEAHNALNYIAKSTVAVTMNALMDTVYNADTNQKEGLNTLIDKMKGTAALTRGQESNVYKVLENLMEGRVYGISVSGDKKLAHATTKLKKYSSMVGMGINRASAMTNFLQGSMATWIETAGGKSGLFTAKNRLNGALKFDNNLIQLTLDYNRNIPESKTGLLLQLYNQSEEFRALKDEFSKTNLASKQLDSSLLFLPQHVTEQAISGILMYSIMDNIKVKNKDGKFINKDGEVVENREDAMSYDEAYSVENGRLVMHPDVASTEKTEEVGTVDSMFVISNLISRSSRDLFGNYNPQNKSIFKRTVIGNLMEHMRGWLVTGMMKRWKGGANWNVKYGEEDIRNVKFNRETQQIESGTYMEIIRFMSNVIMSIKAAGIKAIPEVWNTMTQLEKARIKKAVVEWGVMIGLLALSNATDDDDDIWVAYLALRTKNEFNVFSNPMEMYRMTRSIAISAGLIKDSMEVVWQGISAPTEKYTTGRRRGESKLYKQVTDIVPVLKELNKDNKEMFNLLSR